MSPWNFESHLEDLFRAAQQDLSVAHVAQHGHTARLAVDIRGISARGPGAYSIKRQRDTVDLSTGGLTGKKHWVSNLSRVGWCVLVMSGRVLYVELDPRRCHITMTPTVGMEATLTGNIEFDHAPYEIICDAESDEYFPVRRCNSLGFIANHYGLATALHTDLDHLMRSREIPCGYDLQKLKLQLDVMSLLWRSLPKTISAAHRDHGHWRQKEVLYAHAKRCLLDAVHVVTEVANSGLYRPGCPQHQRYLDGLIYCSHMKNLYASMT